MTLSRRSFMSSALVAAAAASVPGLSLAQSDVLRYDVPRRMLPARVATPAGLAPGEIHIVPDAFMLFHTRHDGTSIRYRVGVARPSLYEAGRYYVGAKREWPSWTPTAEMIAREPETYAQYQGRSVPGGVDNPLGARALYLFERGRGDTFLRIHGTHFPDTIGYAVSNGCARLVNDQVAHLYARVPMGTPVTLHPMRRG